jgi:antitoxin YefM
MCAHSAAARPSGHGHSPVNGRPAWWARSSPTRIRARYAEVLDSVVDDREEVVITRAGREPVVMVSLEDYEALKETAYLLRSPENVRRLLASIERLESGQGLPRDLTE